MICTACWQISCNLLIASLYLLIFSRVWGTFAIKKKWITLLKPDISQFSRIDWMKSMFEQSFCLLRKCWTCLTLESLFVASFDSVKGSDICEDWSNRHNILACQGDRNPLLLQVILSWKEENGQWLARGASIYIQKGLWITVPSHLLCQWNLYSNFAAQQKWFSRWNLIT